MMDPAIGICATTEDIRLVILLNVGITPFNDGIMDEDKDEAKLFAVPEAIKTLPTTEERAPDIVERAIGRKVSSGIIAIFNPSGMKLVPKPTRLPIADESDDIVVVRVPIRLEIGLVPVPV